MLIAQVAGRLQRRFSIQQLRHESARRKHGAPTFSRPDLY